MRRAGEDGSILPLFGTAMAAAALVLVLVVDLVAYLAAASRAQAAADAAALAAIVLADPRAGSLGDPHREAVRVATASAGRLESCSCSRGSERVRVELSVEVPAIVVTRLAARRVTAVATAELRPGEPPVSTPVGPPFRRG